MDMKLAITQLAHGILSPEETEKAKGARYLMLATPLGKLTERQSHKASSPFPVSRGVIFTSLVVHDVI